MHFSGKNSLTLYFLHLLSCGSLVFTDIGTCAITAIPFEKSKVLFSLEEMEEFSLVDETDAAAMATDLAPSTASLEKWGWIMFECGIENLTVKGKTHCFFLFIFVTLNVFHAD